MFCPNCGASSDSGRYCRRCGTEVGRVAEALQAQDQQQVVAARPHPTAFGIFNHQSISNTAGDVEGHVGLSIFGSITLDLRARPLPYGETRVGMSTIFGSVLIRVPDDVGVKITGLSVFSTSKVKGQRVGSGSVEVHEYETPGYSRMGKRLRIDATVIFGTLKVKG
jgi:predicted membrane protein